MCGFVTIYKLMYVFNRWEPTEPLVIAFWSVAGLCLLLIVALVACCLLWRTTKQQRDRFYKDYGPDNVEREPYAMSNSK